MECRSVPVNAVQHRPLPDVRLLSGRSSLRQGPTRALGVLRQPLCIASALGLALTSVVIAFLRFGWTAQMGFLIPLLVLLAVIAVLDLKTNIIPDVLTLPGIAYALVIAVPMESSTLVAAVLGGIVGGGVVLLLAVVSRGAVGGGDIKLASMLGAALGWKAVLPVLAISQVGGALIAVIFLIARRAGSRDHLPVGTIISLAGIATLIGNP